MRAFFDSLRLSALILGAILGAGFISGQELITFFGVGNFLPFFILSCLLIFLVLGFTFVYSSERDDGKNDGRLINIAMYFSSFTVSVCSLSGLSELLSEEIYDFGFPIYSVILLLIAFTVCRNGVKWVENVNLIIVPLLIAITVVIIVKRNIYTYNRELKSGFGISKAVLYVFLNVFSNLKIVLIGGKGKKTSSKILSATIISSVIFLLGTVILLSLSAVKGAENSELPVIYLTSTALGRICIDTALFFAMFSSLIADVCPLVDWAKRKSEKSFYTASVFLSILLFSLIKLKNIVKYLYPVVGGIGLIYFIWSIKKCTVSIIEKRGAKCLKRKRSKS